MNKQYITRQMLLLSLRVFVISCIVLGLYVWGVIFWEGIEKIFREDHYYNPVIRNIFSDTTGIHLPYLGMLFVFAALILFYEMLTARGKNYALSVVRLLCILFLLFSVATFMARMSLFIFFVVAVFFCIKRIKSSKQLIGAALFGVIIIATVILIPSSQRRIKESLTAKYELPHAGQPSEEVNFRFGVYHCVHQVLKEHWLTGVGVDNVQKELDNCYSAYTYRGTDDFINISYNSHNQYLDIMLKYGVFGLVIFLFSLLWGIKNRNILYQGFIIVIFIALITENMFTRQVGVIFFTFFNMLFFVNKEQKVLP
jgi:O-antigen ligase